MNFNENEDREFNKVAAAVIEDEEGRILISQRKETSTFPLLWEFPGGKIEDSENGREALMREIMEELGVKIEVGEALVRKTHEYTDLVVDFLAFRAKIVSGEPECLECKAFKWVKPTELRNYKFPPADKDVIGLLVGDLA